MTTAVPKEIASAIIKVVQLAPRLVKADENKHAKYNYVSIDGYYEVIPGLAAKHGLSWSIREIGPAEVLGEKSLRFTYAFDLFHESGLTCPGYAAFTVVHPIQGAQTSGSAASYAEKLFMRTTFKVVTGEEDADALDPKELDRLPPKPAKAATPAKGTPTTVKPEAKPEPKAQSKALLDLTPVGLTPDEVLAVVDTLPDENNPHPVFKKPDVWEGWKIIEVGFTVFAPRCETRDSLLDFWRDNCIVIEDMEKEAPESFAEVKRVFGECRKKLEKK